ncbi:hypothetical protein EJ02DRAFT_266233 [Clathrospora elynae]|uniref:Uncharacterized protein n=1 Tax=Clathrospora elynae TaxID=706981 RepID=A0A6A5SIA1_9PLEO|nr:hypothetical protein EJ02DRAFT_266233 [Clathrospora elynae]
MSRPPTAGYRPLSPYTDDDTTFANNLLCPRYAECDPTYAPPSPASIESFDVLDNIPWRRSYIPLDSGERRGSGVCNRLRGRWLKNKSRGMTVLLLTLVVSGCTLGGYLAIKHKNHK